MLLASAVVLWWQSPVLGHLGCARSWGCSQKSIAQPLMHPELKMVGFPLSSSLSKLFSEEVWGCREAPLLCPLPLA